MGSQRLDKFFVLADDALASDGGDDFETALPPFLAHPRDHGFLDVEGHAFFESPAQQGQGVGGAARQIVEGQNEDAHAGIRNQQGHVRTGSGNAIEYAAQSRAHGIGLRDIGLHGRRHDGSGGEQLNGNFVQVPANFSPSRRRHVLAGNLHDESGVRHFV